MEVMADRWQDFRLLPPPGDGEAEEDGVMVMYSSLPLSRDAVGCGSELKLVYTMGYRKTRWWGDDMVEMLRAMDRFC
jgi:hypothetical protein